jgi:hypothetical protein
MSLLKPYAAIQGSCNTKECVKLYLPGPLTRPSDTLSPRRGEELRWRIAEIQWFWRKSTLLYAIGVIDLPRIRLRVKFYVPCSLTRPPDTLSPRRGEKLRWCIKNLNFFRLQPVLLIAFLEWAGSMRLRLLSQACTTDVRFKRSKIPATSPLPASVHRHPSSVMGEGRVRVLLTGALALITNQLTLRACVKNPLG